MEDMNQIAKRVVDKATGEPEKTAYDPEKLEKARSQMQSIMYSYDVKGEVLNDTIMVLDAYNVKEMEWMLEYKQSEVTERGKIITRVNKKKGKLQAQLAKCKSAMEVACTMLEQCMHDKGFSTIGQKMLEKLQKALATFDKPEGEDG